MTWLARLAQRFGLARGLSLGLLLGLAALRLADPILLHELRPHALLPAGHALADRAEVSLADLAAYPLITTDQPQSWQHMLDLFRTEL